MKGGMRNPSSTSALHGRSYEPSTRQLATQVEVQQQGDCTLVSRYPGTGFRTWQAIIGGQELCIARYDASNAPDYCTSHSRPQSGSAKRGEDAGARRMGVR